MDAYRCWSGAVYLIKALPYKLILGILAFLLCGTQAHAIPLLQLYVEGAEYDTDHESWVFNLTDPSETIRLWVIGNVSGPGGKATISDVRLSAVYSDPVPEDGGSSVDISLAPSTTGGFGGFTDPSTPTGTGSLLQINESGDLPLLTDGKPLAAHGTYGDGFEWQEFDLGDFTATDSPVADFINVFPGAPAVLEGQINVYEVGVAGPITDIHFDVYNHVMAGNHGKVKSVFGPFSHDAGTGINSRVPEPDPTFLLLMGSGLLGLAARILRSLKCIR